MTGEQLLHDKETERKLLETCIKAGGLDGVSGEKEPSVDGIPPNIHGNIVEMIRILSEGGKGNKI